MAMSSTTCPSSLGMPMINGLLPMELDFPPHAGMHDSVLVQQMLMYPFSAACHPKAPPRIQCVVLRRLTMPMPLAAAISVALSIQCKAFRIPGPRLPS